MSINTNVGVLSLSSLFFAIHSMLYTIICYIYIYIYTIICYTYSAREEKAPVAEPGLMKNFF